MLVVERRMLHVKAVSIKSLLNSISTEKKFFKNCSKVSCDPGTVWKKELRCCKFCFFPVTNAGCLPGLCHHCRFFQDEWHSDERLVSSIDDLIFFPNIWTINSAIQSSTLQAIQKRLSNRVWSMIWSDLFFLIVCAYGDTALILTGY